jgi:lysophospholipase L1-like esterase
MKYMASIIASFAFIVMNAGCGTTPTVVFMGDSITYLWGLPSVGGLIFQQHPFWIDVGVSGNTSGQMAARFQQDVIARHPGVVAILAGTNDVYPGWTLCGAVGATDTCHNIISMVSQAQSNGIEPVLATIPPWGCKESVCALAEDVDSDSGRYERIDALNQWIKAYGKQHALVVIDYWLPLVATDKETYVPSMTMDGVHPSAQGYAMMDPLIEDALTQVP